MLDALAGNDTLSTLVAFGLVLIPAIFIHELGHFLAAKAVGISILEFGIGLPPRALTLLQRGETRYTLNWLPFGGFVRPLGENFAHPVDAQRVAQERAQLDAGGYRVRTLGEASPLARIVFMCAGPAANLLTAMLLFMLIGLGGLPTVTGGSAGVASIAADSPLAAAGLAPGDRILAIDGRRPNAASELPSLLEARAGQEIVLSLERENEIFDLVLIAPVLTFETSALVLIVAPDSPAEYAGIRPDDRVLTFNGQTLANIEQLGELTRMQPGQEIALGILRDGESLDLRLVPRLDPPPGEGAIGIGITSAWSAGVLTLIEGGWQQEQRPLSPGESLRYGLEQLRFYVETLATLPGRLLAGSLQPEEARLMSPLAISQVGGRFLQDSIAQEQPQVILGFMALISVALGITNLLPLPALDGGRILFVLVELVRGRPVTQEREGIVHLFGMALLFSLMIFTLLNDVFNPVGELLP